MNSPNNNRDKLDIVANIPHVIMNMEQSKKELREHKDRNHRITNSKTVQLKGLIPVITTTTYCWMYEVLLSTESTNPICYIVSED
jgi:hypothetical protein